MSFGFSVGDFITVGKLIADITTSLKDAGGSKSDYQELLRELECLDHALRHLDRLHLRGSSITNLDSIKYAALSCRRPLEEFFDRIKKYDKSLGSRSKGSAVKGTANKLRWGLGETDRIRKLQSYLNVHVGTLNILLAEHGLEMLDLASEKAEADRSSIQERLENTRTIVTRIKDNVVAQATVVQNNNSMLASLSQMISGEFSVSWKSLANMVAKVCVSTQQIYSLVLDIKTSLPSPDTRWTFFQAPLAVEDALGFKFPVPSEYSHELLDTIIRHRFEKGPGSIEVKAGNYEIFKTQNSSQVVTANMRLLPGTGITMAIIVVVGYGELNILLPELLPLRLTEASCKCNVWFDQSSKKRKVSEGLFDSIGESDCKSDDHEPMPVPNGSYRARKRARLSHERDDLEAFKNVKVDNDRVLHAATPGGIRLFFPSGSGEAVIVDPNYDTVLQGVAAKRHSVWTICHWLQELLGEPVWFLPSDSCESAIQSDSAAIRTHLEDIQRCRAPSARSRPGTLLSIDPL